MGPTLSVPMSFTMKHNHQTYDWDKRSGKISFRAIAGRGESGEALEYGTRWWRSDPDIQIVDNWTTMLHKRRADTADVTSSCVF